MLVIKKGFQYRNLGGHPFYKERELSPNTVIDKAILEGNWACINFMDRRKDYDCNFPYKLYYGHSDDGLGYVMAEDELEEVPDDVWAKERSKHLSGNFIRKLLHNIFK